MSFYRERIKSCLPYKRTPFFPWEEGAWVAYE
ncbi:hypothetical protein OF001_U150013 [Pseudomonas sp. OF001]|nr:hypothetical protein OF001_U150013 [Pseudomonas sp. OF001]